MRPEMESPIPPTMDSAASYPLTTLVELFTAVSPANEDICACKTLRAVSGSTIGLLARLS